MSSDWHFKITNSCLPYWRVIYGLLWSIYNLLHVACELASGDCEIPPGMHPASQRNHPDNAKCKNPKNINFGLSDVVKLRLSNCIRPGAFLCFFFKIFIVARCSTLLCWPKGWQEYLSERLILFLCLTGWRRASQSGVYQGQGPVPPEGAGEGGWKPSGELKSFHQP